MAGGITYLNVVVAKKMAQDKTPALFLNMKHQNVIKNKDIMNWRLIGGFWT